MTAAQHLEHQLLDLRPQLRLRDPDAPLLPDHTVCGAGTVASMARSRWRSSKVPVSTRHESRSGETVEEPVARYTG